MFIQTLIKKYVSDCIKTSHRHICSCGNPIVCKALSVDDFVKRLPEIEAAILNNLGSIRIEFGPDVSDNVKVFTREIFLTINKVVNDMVLNGPGPYQNNLIIINPARRNEDGQVEDKFISLG